MRCENCGREFEAARKTARFCSEKCQKGAKRAEISRTGKQLEGQISRTNPVSRTGKPENPPNSQDPVSRTNPEKLNDIIGLPVSRTNQSAEKHGDIPTKDAKGVKGDKTAENPSNNATVRQAKQANTATEVKQALKTMTLTKTTDIDNENSPDFDLSEAGFIRRNEDWLDDSCYPGTPESRKKLMQIIAQRHARIMRRQQQQDEIRAREWA